MFVVFLIKKKKTNFSIFQKNTLYPQPLLKINRQKKRRRVTTPGRLTKVVTHGSSLNARFFCFLRFLFFFSLIFFFSFCLSFCFSFSLFPFLLRFVFFLIMFSFFSVSTLKLVTAAGPLGGKMMSKQKEKNCPICSNFEKKILS